MNKANFQQFVLSNIKCIKNRCGLRWVFVRVKFVENTDYYMALAGGFPSPVVILYVDYSARKLGKDSVIGLLAHEFAHYDTSDEREADRRALEAGFQVNLVAFHLAHNKRFEAYKPDEGMTLAEIKSWTRVKHQ